MSYILDALKKSEMQARQGELPTIHSTHGLGGARPGRPGWHYVLFGGTAAAVLFSIVLILQEKPQPDAPRPVPAAPDPAATTASSISPQAVPSSPDPVMPPTPAMAPVPATHAGAPITSPSPRGTVAGKPSASAPAEETPRTASKQAGTAEAIPIPDVRPAHAVPPLLGKLPVGVQQSLPKIDIAGHIYDENPSVRMVFINGQIRREGDSIAPGLRLTAITPDGVQFSYRDTPFRIELFGNRPGGAR